MVDFESNHGFGEMIMCNIYDKTVISLKEGRRMTFNSRLSVYGLGPGF